ncbi:iron-sulfur cluster repair di-iron protein [Neobacillus notoginsengisoli]|uniref:Iron-sulfur cluster repair di-iron protein n=1 Tax=Neobacillus notoginsengisoli TaxID=1578198 RepID=A0A417YZH6_9BACI|nr:iron-sulfur cluster repair di-iron protein [Neobacillus notoginsengisoli]RHW43196.1 iron-sulfur cluster repair di-iron protein [Neobacillus notoginsengisoli]
MLKTYSEQTLVRDLVNDFPKTADVFKSVRIDFCCGGATPIAEAAATGGVDLGVLMANLTEVIEKSSNGEDDMKVWIDSDSNTIIDHVISEYHNPLREEFLNLSPYVTKVSRVHGGHRPELLKVYELYYELKKEMLEHVAKEEETVFPLIKQLDDNTVEDRDGALNYIKELEAEHDHAGAILKQLRDITSDFIPPADACGTYRLVYKRLEMLEAQTFMHVHLENNILFPRYF